MSEIHICIMVKDVSIDNLWRINLNPYKFCVFLYMILIYRLVL